MENLPNEILYRILTPGQENIHIRFDKPTEGFQADRREIATDIISFAKTHKRALIASSCFLCQHRNIDCGHEETFKIFTKILPLPFLEAELFLNANLFVKADQKAWSLSRVELLVSKYDDFIATLSSADRSLTIKDLAITLFQTDQGPPIDRDAIKKDLSEFSIKNWVIDVHKFTIPAPTMVDCFSWENPDLETLSAKRLMKIRRRQRGRKSYF